MRIKPKRKSRQVEPALNEYYHLYNRGVLKKTIFHDQRDYTRFLFSLLYFQSPIIFSNLSRPVTHFVRRQTFNIKQEVREKIARTRLVELNSFCLMPNHFHLTVRLVRDDGLALYMQRVLTAYAKYYNVKYKQSGHLFQGVYQAVHIENNEQLLYTSAYIHKHRTAWSSYRDYTETNRWGNLLVSDLILGQFCDGKDYSHWVKNTQAKEIAKTPPDSIELLDV